MTIHAWLLFCLTEAVLCLSPGPAVLLVVSIALRGGARRALAACLGILAANSLYFILSATGLAALLKMSSVFFQWVQWVGAAYLIWLGGRILLATFRPERESPTRAPEQGLRRSFSHGFLTQASNPKLLAFFAAILPQFIDPSAAIAPQIAILGISSIAIEFLVLAGYAAAGARAGELASPRLQRAVERAGGGLLIGAGAGLAALGRE